MKKTLLSFIAATLLATTLIFVGCGKDDDFYSKTAEAVSIFYQTEEYAFLFDDEIKLDYGTYINQHISNNDEEFALLETFYEASLKNLTYMFSNFHTNLSLEPQHKNKSLKTTYKNLEKQTEAFKKSIDSFLQEKTIFVNLVDTNPTLQSSKSHLKQFKTHYKKLLYSAESFNQAFKSVYTQGFLTYPNMESTTVQPGVQKLIPAIAVGDLTSINLAYMFDDESLIEHEANSLTLLTQANKIKQLSISSTKPEEDISIENLKLFLQTESVYKTEVVQFKQALDRFSFSEYYYADKPIDFLNKDDNRLYFDKINTFINSYTSIYTNSMINNLL